MGKISGYTEKTSLAANDVFIIVDSVSGLDKKVKYSTIQNAVGIGTTETLLLSDPDVYDVTTRTLTIPDDQLAGVKFQLHVTPYDDETVYGLNEIVSSDGTDGGVLGRCYKSKADANEGNALSDATKWEFADSLGGNVGNVEIDSFGDPSCLPDDHLSKFVSDGVTTPLFIHTNAADAGEGDIVLDNNTDVLLQYYFSFLTLINESGVSVKQAAGIIS